MDLGDFPFIHDPTTHKRRPGDQKFMRFFKGNERQSSFFCRIAGCEKSVNGHRPGDFVNAHWYDPNLDPRESYPGDGDSTWVALEYECGCFIAKGMC